MSSEAQWLACPVRGCARALVRGGAAFACERGHSFDVARSGYLNLIQPQDRRSLDAGDSRASAAARRELLDAGFGDALRAAAIDAAAELALERGARVLDLGCGDGHFLAALCERFSFEGCGVDLSVHALERAAKRHAALTWIAANADRRLPFADSSFALGISIDGRRNPAELARVLAPRGALVVAVPAPDDLCELRAAVHGVANEIDRASRVESEFAPGFVVRARRTARARVRLDRDGLARLAAATYRCGRSRENDALNALAELEVTTSHSVLTLRRAD